MIYECMCQFWKRKYRKKKKACVAVAWKWSARVTIFYMPQQLSCLGMCKIVTLGKKMTANRIFTKFQLCAFKLVWVCELAESESSKVSDKTFLICQFYWPPNFKIMMTSSNGNIFRVTGPLWGEFTGDRWIPLTNASDAELWYFLWYVPEQTVDNRDTDDLRCRWAHYDITVMQCTDFDHPILWPWPCAQSAADMSVL